MKSYKWILVVLLALETALMPTLSAATSTKDIPNLSCSFVGNGADMLLWAETPAGPGQLAVHPREGLGLIKWKLQIVNGVASRADPKDNHYSQEGPLAFISSRWERNLFRVERQDQVTLISADPTWAELVVIDVAANGVYFYPFACTSWK